MANSERVRALRCDQRRRWQEGERIRVEAYLEQQPDLRSDSEGILDLIYNEIVLREEHSESPGLDDYLARFPQFAAQLRLQFEVHEALEESSLTSVGSGSRTEHMAFSGFRVAGYELVEEIGRGGMGVVYRAVQQSLKRPVALKMILAGAHAGPEERARFRTEAEAAARLIHPNIVQIYEVGEQDGCLFLAMELVDGVGLDKHFGGRPAPPRQAAQLVKTVARAMHEAHRRGIVHRDLKPANILLVSGRVVSGEWSENARNSPLTTQHSPLTPKVADFGLAKLLDGSARHTPTTAFLGTPSYMAPEQALGRGRDIGPTTDVYALGAILYELLTGAAPFEGETAAATVELVRSQDPTPPRRRQPSVPRDLEIICLKCLHKEPGKRYASAEALADDLQRFLAGEPIQARPAAAAERLLKWARRRPAIAMLIGLLSVGVVSFPAFLAWHLHSRELASKQGREEVQLKAQQARLEYQQFLEARDEALFHAIYGTFFSDADAARSLQAADAAARRALALVHVDVEGSGDGTEVTAFGDSALSDAEREEVRMACYQLLLVLADVAASAPVGPASRAGSAGDAAAKQALALLDRASRLGPATPAFHLRRARYLHQLGDAAGEREERARAETRKPRTACDYFLLGQERFRQGKFAHAYVDFKQSLAARPDDFWCQFFLALDCLEMHRAAEAKECLTDCARQRPRFVWTYLVRARAHELLRATAAAEADYETALGLHPNEDARYALHVNRGEMRLRQKRRAAAIADFEQAAALKPDRHDAHFKLAQAYRQRGWAYFFADAFKPALADFETALRLDPDDAEARVGRGLARVNLGQPRLAAEDGDEALRRKPTTPEMMHNIACIFARAAERIAQDKGAENAQKAARYRMQAVDAVRKTLDLVPTAGRRAFWRDKVLPDTYLDPVRDSPAFRQLVDEYGGP
jgi:tetratricopeptide (TPR) repeat protein